MKREILKFVKEICEKFSLKCTYIPNVNNQNDVWSFTTKNGHAVQSFTTAIFYHIPPTARMQMFMPTIKRGLMNLVGRSDIKRTQQTIQNRKLGKQII